MTFSWSMTDEESAQAGRWRGCCKQRVLRSGREAQQGAGAGCSLGKWGEWEKHDPAFVENVQMPGTIPRIMHELYHLIFTRDTLFLSLQ